MQKELTISQVKEIIKKYKGIKLNLRQIYYQLVANYNLENNPNNYKYLSKILVNARKSLEIDYDSLEDNTRTFHHHFSSSEVIIKKEVTSMVDYFMEKEISIPRSSYQEELCLIVVEKAALEKMIKKAINFDLNIIMIINRGYNSLSQIYELCKHIKNLNIKTLNILYFGDYDPSGLDIERNFIKQVQEQLPGMEIKSERLALTNEQIIKYNLPTAIPKEKDKRTKNFIDSKCVELDSLDPNELISLIIKNQDRFWNKEIEKAVVRYNLIINRIFRRNLERELKIRFQK